jgi:hypothetical protein
MTEPVVPVLPSTEEGRAKLEEIRAKNPSAKLHFFEDPEEFGLVIFRRPGKLDLRAFKADRDDEDLKPMADERLSAKLVLYPDAVGFNTLLDSYPVLASNISQQAVKLAGGGKLDVKKG